MESATISSSVSGSGMETKSRVATVLVIDDEQSIRRTLRGILEDDGINVLVAEDGLAALNLLKQKRPDAVILDIWMPGVDGLELLGKIKQIYRELPVIMISGHATIATAVKATRLGAVDFIEKPLDLNVVIQAVKRALNGNAGSLDHDDALSITSDESGELGIGRLWDPASLNRVVFGPLKSSWKGKKVTQRTLASSALLYGQGLHSGRKSGLIFEPLPPDSGIHFVGVSEKTVVPAHVDCVESTGFATTVKLGDTQAGTIEHLMSALHAYGICNLLIKCNGEVPVLDGSSREFCALFDEVGLSDQPGDWYEIAIQDLVRVGDDREFIQFEPAEHFEIDYTLQYPAPIGRQHFSFRLDSVESYKKEIAPARTFGFVNDIGMLQKQGLALGGRFDNFVLLGEAGAINDTLRFADEPVRHKVLDAMGDLYLLGRPIRGKVTAQMTGHSDNISLLCKLQERFLE